MIVIALLATLAAWVCALYSLRGTGRLELETARLRADLAALDENAAAGLSAAAEVIAELEAERDTARGHFAAERHARNASLAEVAELRRRLGPLCNGCGNALDLDVCQCGSPIAAHPDEGHRVVPQGCECHLDHQPDWQRVAETRHRLCAVAHLRAQRAEDDAAIALAWRPTLVRIAQEVRDERDAISAERDAMSAELDRVYLAAWGIGACRVLAIAKVAGQAAILEQAAAERAQLIAERDAYAARAAELERRTTEYVGATPCLELAR